MALLTFDEALNSVIESARAVGSESVNIDQAFGRYVYRDVISSVDLPRFDNSQMDGYAVRHSEIVAASVMTPVTLKLAATVSAGDSSQRRLATGEAVKIFTGAPLPRGADAVVPIEDVTASAGNAEVTFTLHSQSGAFVRVKGEDICSGDTVATSGDRINAGLVALLASTGNAVVEVFRKPRVAIVSNGNELVNVSVAPHQLRDGQIYESNSVMLNALLIDAGADVVTIVRSADSGPDLRRTFLNIIDSHSPDLILTTGGVSVGDKDYVRPVLTELGTVKFWRASIRPGKPILYGAVGDCHFLGLPGNPASTLVTFELFARPLINLLAGSKSTLSFMGSKAAVDISHEPGRRSFVRAMTHIETSGLVSVPAGMQSSHYVTTLAKANSLIVIPEDVSTIQAGKYCKCLLIGPVTRD